MIYVKRWYLNNPLRNYNYMLVNDETKTALIIDPTFPKHYVEYLTENNFTPEAILLTHEHSDHIAGVNKLKEQYQLPVFTNLTDIKGKGVEKSIQHDDKLIFKTSSCKVIACPGHTAAHVSFYFQEDNALFCGDTIFTAGVGNVLDPTANVEVLFESIVSLSSLPETVKIYPAHDYFENNLQFAQSIDQQDVAYQKWYQKVDGVAPEDKPVTTIGNEKEMNIFFRSNELTLQTLLAKQDAKSAFCQLRALKNAF